MTFQDVGSIKSVIVKHAESNMSRQIECIETAIWELFSIKNSLEAYLMLAIDVG